MPCRSNRCCCLFTGQVNSSIEEEPSKDERVRADKEYREKLERLAIKLAAEKEAKKAKTKALRGRESTTPENSVTFDSKQASPSYVAKVNNVAKDNFLKGVSTVSKENINAPNSHHLKLASSSS